MFVKCVGLLGESQRCMVVLGVFGGRVIPFAGCVGVGVGEWWCSCLSTSLRVRVWVAQISLCMWCGHRCMCFFDSVLC